MENLTGGTPPVRYLPCVVPCKLYFASVEATLTEDCRYEEIQLFEIEITNRTMLYNVAKKVATKIKYPCIVEYKIGDVIVIGTIPFKAGKNDYTKNVNIRPHFSHYLRPESLSDKAVKQVDKINQLLASEGDIKSIYTMIGHEIIYYAMSGMPFAKVERAVKNMLSGKMATNAIKDVKAICIPYEYHAPKYKYSRYRGEKCKNYMLIHDFEEVWYAFMQNEDLRRVIGKRKYRDIEDLVYSIESKNW